VSKYAVESGIINLDDVLHNIKDMERRKILEEHLYEIWQSTDGRWRTYLPDESKKNKRKPLAKSSRKALEDEVVKDYKSRIKEKTDFQTLYYEWLYYALEYGDLTKGTVDRYNNDYDKFYKENPFVNMDVKSIQEVDISRFLKSVVHEFQMTKKCFSNIRALLIGTFTYAKTEREINCIPIRQTLEDIRLPKKHFKQTIIRDSEQVFNDAEAVQLANYILGHYESTKDLGILFALLTGVRVGELCTLKTTDQEDSRIYIQRTEVKEKNELGKTVVKVRDTPKTAASMAGIELNNSAMVVLNMIKKWNLSNGIGSDYLFYDNRYGRTKGTTFDKRIRRICNNIGIPVRSMHKLRKTYASNLFACGVEGKIVQAQMRHRSISTTHKHYEFSMRNREYMRDKLNDADFLGLDNGQKSVAGRM